MFPTETGTEANNEANNEANTVTWFDNSHASLRRAWHPVARVADVGDAPVSVTLLSEPLVLVRLEGELVVLPDRCPHRLAPLSAGVVVRVDDEDRLRCPYHGYEFDGAGRCALIPALGAGATIPPAAHLPTHRVRTHAGLVFVALEEPIVDLPEVPEHGDPAFVRVPLAPTDWNAGAAQMVDNFLDVAHFPFTHTATFGDVDDTEVERYDVAPGEHPWEFSVTHRHLAQALSGSGELVHRTQRYTWTAPLAVRLGITYEEEGSVLTITFFHQPVDATTTRLFITDYRNDPPSDGAEVADFIAGAAAFQAAVGAEDRELLEKFRSKAIPLDAGVEVHTRADRITLEFRRRLAAWVAEAAS